MSYCASGNVERCWPTGYEKSINLIGSFGLHCGQER